MSKINTLTERVHLIELAVKGINNTVSIKIMDFKNENEELKRIYIYLKFCQVRILLLLMMFKLYFA